MVPAVLAGLAVLVLALPGEGWLLLERAGLRPARAGHAPGAPRPAGRRTDRWWWVVGAGIAGLVLLAFGGLSGLVLGVTVVVALRLGRRLRSAQAAARAAAVERRRAAEACAALAAELRAGRGLAQALEQAAWAASGPSAGLLGEAAVVAGAGGDVPSVLRRDSPTAVPEMLAGLSACWQVCSRSGSGLATAVEHLAQGCQGREEQRRAVEAALAGPRATAGLLAVLPVAGVGLAALLGADPLHVLLRTPAGLVCLVLGLGLDGLGLLWTRRLVSRANR